VPGEAWLWWLLYVDTDRPPATTSVQVAASFRPGYVLEVEALAVVA
jgi:hypothetical protein